MWRELNPQWLFRATALQAGPTKPIVELTSVKLEVVEDTIRGSYFGFITDLPWTESNVNGKRTELWTCSIFQTGLP